MKRSSIAVVVSNLLWRAAWERGSDLGVCLRAGNRHLFEDPAGHLVVDSCAQDGFVGTVRNWACRRDDHGADLGGGGAPPVTGGNVQDQITVHEFTGMLPEL